MHPRSRSWWSRALLLAGVGLVASSLLITATLTIAGSAYGLFARPPVLQITVAYGVPLLAGDQYEGSLGGFAYVPPLASYVVEIQSTSDLGSLLLRAPANGASSPPPTSVCRGSAGDLYYPAGGSSLFTQCSNGSNNSAMVAINATDLLPVSNVSLGTRFLGEYFAWDGQHQRLYWLGYDGRLRTVDFADGTLTGNVSVPGGNGTDPLWFDSSSGDLLTGDAGNRSLLTVDPQTGRPLVAVPLPGNVTAIVGDPLTNRVFVAFSGPWTAPDQDGIAVLNASTLDLVAQLMEPNGVWPWAFLDPSHGEVDFTDGFDVAFLNESRDELVVPISHLPGNQGFITSDPQNGSFAIAAESPPSVYVSTYAQTRSCATPIPFSAVPGLGVGTPLDLGGASFLAGVALLVVRRVSLPPPPIPISPDFGDPELQKAGSESEAAFAEASRKRWVEWGKQRENRKP